MRIQSERVPQGLMLSLSLGVRVSAIGHEQLLAWLATDLPGNLALARRRGELLLQGTLPEDEVLAAQRRPEVAADIERAAMRLTDGWALADDPEQALGVGALETALARVAQAAESVDATASSLRAGSLELRVGEVHAARRVTVRADARGLVIAAPLALRLPAPPDAGEVALIRSTVALLILELNAHLLFARLRSSEGVPVAVLADARLPLDATEDELCTALLAVAAAAREATAPLECLHAVRVAREFLSTASPAPSGA